MSTYLFCITLVNLLLLVGCATPELATQADYKAARAHLLQLNYNESLKAMPTKEGNGFVTNLEKGYLETLTQNVEPSNLLMTGKDLERRKIVFLTQEAKEFFYFETEEGYFPAEHEVIILHLVTGMAYAKKGDREGARVEAFKAAQYLQGHYAEHRGDFDDPGLRLWLAALWLYCDEWEHARVDLRVAAKLDPELSWAAKMSENTAPPKNYYLVFGGVGPEPKWDPKNTSQLITGIESLRFESDFLRTNMWIGVGKQKPIKLGAGESSRNWYERHQKRNTAIRDVLSGSKYMLKSGVAVTGYAASQAANTAVAGSLISVGAILGIAIAAPFIYIAVEGSKSGVSGDGAGQLIAIGLAAGYAVGKGAYDTATSAFKKNKEEADESLASTVDISRRYRFVRFLPDTIYAAASNVKDSTQPHVWMDAVWNQKPVISLTSNKGTNIHFFHVAY